MAATILQKEREAMNYDLAGKIIVVTGASSGIGRATIRVLAAEGCKIALVARESDRLRKVADEIGDAAFVVPTDLARPEETDRMVETVLGHFGRIDVLLANAGIYIHGDVADGDPDDWDRLLQINVASVFRAVRRVLPGMIARGEGDILVTSSIAGHQAIPWEPIYSASKHAIRSFVHGLRRQVLKQDIRISSVSPGMVLNELWGIASQEEIDRRAEAREGLRSEDVAEAILFALTRPRNVTIRDLVMLPAGQDL
jgi:ribitol 2-dehydrogenase